jgi:hypothetical protein
MSFIHDLLANGYFPRELPPSFHTTGFAVAMTSTGTAFPAAMRDTQRVAKLCKHNLARVGGLRRTLSIPNPVPHFNLCEAMETLRPLLRPVFAASPISLSKPRLSDERAVVPATAISEILPRAVIARAAAPYVARTDINRFYGSVYTHSIPWAVHGKAATKAALRAKPRVRLSADALDLWVRNAQDQQTVGIPVGPDTSLVIAELVLGAADLELKTRLGQLRGVRYVDDYELAFRSVDAAENGLALLQEILTDYELALNPTKTDITSVPRFLVSGWTEQLRNYDKGRSRSEQRELIRYFNNAFQIAIEHPTEGVLKYALGRLRLETISSENYELFEAMILQATLADPGTLPLAIEILLSAAERRLTLNRERIEEVLNIHIEKHSPLGHGSEVAWALWAVIRFGWKIGPAAAAALSKFMDSVVAILALHAESQGCIPSGLDKTAYMTFMTEDELYGTQWLLAYEAAVQGWSAPLVGGANYAAKDPCFAFMAKNNVKFYDPARPLVRSEAPFYPPEMRAVAPARSV